MARAPKTGPTPTRARLVLVLLILVDFLSFVTLGSDQGSLVFSLAPSSMAIVQVCLDAALAVGLLRLWPWALELVRYRCILGIGYLLFVWLLYAMTIDASQTLRLEGVLLVAAVRDAVLGFWLAGCLVLLRKRPAPHLPKADPLVPTPRTDRSDD
jgi:hypothetical protein